MSDGAKHSSRDGLAEAAKQSPPESFAEAATVELKPIAPASAAAATTELQISALRAAAVIEPPDAPPPATAGKPGAFAVTRAPHLAHIGESRVAAIGIETILEGPDHVREAAYRLAAAGFNALAVPLLDEGYTLSPSAAMAERGLPRQHPDLHRRDVMAECCDVATELKIPLLLTVEFLKAGDRGLGVRYPVLRRHRRWAMRNAQGHMLPLGPETQCPLLCPSVRGVPDHYASVCIEAATAYPVSGFILDMPPLLAADSAAPLSDYCYCMRCRERFLNELAGGDDPAALTGDADFLRRKAWAFRRQVQQAILHVRNRVLGVRSDCQFFLQGIIHRDGAEAAVALDPASAWYPLAANGALNGVFVSNYSFRPADFAAELEQDAALLPSECNIGAALRSIRAETLAEQIGLLREHGACAFLAIHAAGLSPDELALLERDTLLWPGFHVESAPRRAVDACLRRLQFINAGCPPLSAFFRDITRFFATRSGQLAIGDVEAMIDNLESIRIKIRQGALPLTQPPGKVQRLMAQLQKSLFMLCKTLHG